MALPCLFYGGIVWAAERLAAPRCGISTPLNPVARVVENIGGGYSSFLGIPL